MLTVLAGYLALGAVSGVMAGVFGVGGGLIIVPALVFAFTMQGIDASVTMHLAIGTSLATIAVTGTSSAWGHWRKGSVICDWLLALLPGLMLGAVAGVFVAGSLSGGWLGTLFGVFVLGMALIIGLELRPRAGSRPPGPWAMRTAGGVIGGASALFGIGGGALSVPWLIRCGASMTQAVGTSSACGLPIALFGTLTYVMVGWGNPALPAWSSGFVMWPAVLGIGLASVPGARLGVRLAHRLPAKVLRLAFASLMAVVGLSFLV